jgi:WD40 repeat protein
LALGTYPISFSYSGDTNFISATGSGSLGISGFQATGTMSVERSFHTATLLPSGKVLVAGGFNKSGASLATSEVYDPASRTFTSTANNMPNKAAGHTATLLSNGKVLVVGGGNSSSQVYDPSTNTWGPSGGSGARSYHTATVLNNGQVLIAGGSDNSGKALSSAVLYDPVAGSFTSTGNMTAAREFHTASLLPDGTVLIAGGRAASGSSYVYLNTAEIYNPVTGTFSAIANMTTARYGHIAVVYNGNILIAGGSNGGATALATAELFNPTTKTFTGTGSMAASQGRQNFTATVMTSGVLVAGGVGGATAFSSAETYQAGVFSPAGNMTAARSAHTATLLQDGTVLITGGLGSTGNSVATADLYKSQ